MAWQLGHPGPQARKPVPDRPQLRRRRVHTTCSCENRAVKLRNYLRSVTSQRLRPFSRYSLSQPGQPTDRPPQFPRFLQPISTWSCFLAPVPAPAPRSVFASTRATVLKPASALTLYETPSVLLPPPNATSAVTTGYQRTSCSTRTITSTSTSSSTPGHARVLVPLPPLPLTPTSTIAPLPS